MRWFALACGVAWDLVGGLAWATYPIPDTVDVDLTGIVPITIMICSALCVVWIGRKMIRMWNKS